MRRDSEGILTEEVGDEMKMNYGDSCLRKDACATHLTLHNTS